MITATIMDKKRHKMTSLHGIPTGLPEMSSCTSYNATYMKKAEASMNVGREGRTA